MVSTTAREIISQGERISPPHEPTKLKILILEHEPYSIRSIEKLKNAGFLVDKYQPNSDNLNELLPEYHGFIAGDSIH